MAKHEIIKNISWLFGDHVITFAGGLFVSVWLANYLGPANYGAYSYAIALFSIASAFSHLGLHGVSVKELVESSNVSKSLGLIGMLKAVGAILAFTCLQLYLVIAGVDGVKYYTTFVLSFAILLVPLTVIDNYFDSITKSKYRIFSRKSGFVIRSLVVILFIILGLSFNYLPFIIASEFFIAALLILIIYYNKGVGVRFIVDFSKIKALLNESWPLIISGLGAILYLKMDQVMVVEMVNEEEGGYYGAAVRYSSVFYFLHTIILTSLFPKLVEARRENERHYLNLTTKITAFLLYSSIAIIFFTLVFGGWIVNLLFGFEYIPAVEIIGYHILILPLVYLGAVLSKWLVIEKLTRWSIVRHGMGFLVNLLLNLALIPVYGGVGAAIASVVSLVFANLVILVFTSRLRLLASLFIKSFVFPVKLLRK